MAIAQQYNATAMVAFVEQIQQYIHLIWQVFNTTTRVVTGQCTEVPMVIVQQHNINRNSSTMQST